MKTPYPAGNCMFKVSNKVLRTTPNDRGALFYVGKFIKVTPNKVKWVMKKMEFNVVTFVDFEQVKCLLGAFFPRPSLKSCSRSTFTTNLLSNHFALPQKVL